MSSAANSTTADLSTFERDRDTLLNLLIKLNALAMFTAAQGDDPDAVRLLIAAGIDVNIKTDRRGARPQYTKVADEYTPLYVAAKDSGNPNIMRLLIAAGADVNAMTSCFEPRTPLSAAARRGDLVAVRLLLDAGANVFLASRRCDTPLHHAVFGGNLDIVRLFINSGASGHKVGHDYRTPFEVAVRMQRLPGRPDGMAMVNLFAELGADATSDPKQRIEYERQLYNH